MNATATIDRVHSLSVDRFLTEYLVPNHPVVICDALDGQRSLTDWTPRRFEEQFGDVNVIPSSGDRRFKSTLRDYLRYALTYKASNGAEQNALYMHSVNLGRVFPKLLSEFDDPAYFIAMIVRL